MWKCITYKTSSPNGSERIHATWDIQIKICAEYRYMLPRPRLVCHEPGLKPIGRSPCVPDKSNFYSSVGLIGHFAGLPPCTVPSALVHCNQNEAGYQTIKAPSMPCSGSACPWKHSLAFMPRGWWNWRIKWMESVSVGSYQYKNQVNGEFFLYICE